MYYKKIFQFSFLLFLLFSLNPVLAQGDTLEDALVLAYQTNPELIAARAELMEQDEVYAQALSGYLPSLSLNGNYNLSRNRQKAIFTNYSTADVATLEASLSQPLYTGGRVSAAIGEAKAIIYAARERLNAKEQNILRLAAQAYLDVRRDISVLEIRKNNVEVLRRQLNAAQDRFSVGEGTRTDKAQAEARLAGALSELSKAEAQLFFSREAYNKVIGLYPGSLEKEPPIKNLPKNIEQALLIAGKQNPNLRMAQFSEVAAKEKVRSARASLMPSVNLSARLASDYKRKPISVDTNSASVGIGFSIPFYRGGLLRSRLRATKRGAIKQRYNTRNLERQVVELVTNTWNSYSSSKIIIESRKKQVEANSIAFEGVELENQVGLRTTLDVLNAEQELLEAKLALVFAERNSYVEAFKLLESIGALKAKNLELSVKMYDVEENYKRVKNPVSSFSTR